MLAKNTDVLSGKDYLITWKTIITNRFDSAAFKLTHADLFNQFSRSTNTLTSVQQLVGGTIQAVYPFEEPVALICNDEGKLLNLPPNRALRDCNGAIYDIVAGTFFLCAASADSDRFESLTDEQAQTYMERFAMPEQFIKVKGAIVVLPYL